MNIFENLAPLGQRIQESLNRSVQDSFPQTLKEPIQYFLEASGKKIRPLFTVLSCQAVGGNIEDALDAAVGIELFHDFTLIHDDIMDRDDLRRGRLTIHKKWDEGIAILAGDAMIGMAYENMLKHDNKHTGRISKLFSEALIKVCEGQALDKEFEKRDDVSLTEYLDMISKKTAWLLKLSCSVGAILGGANEAQINALNEFGENLGIGFQIQDDLLDIIADESKLGKKVGSDFLMGKKTYISIKYREVVQSRQLSHEFVTDFQQFTSLQELKKALQDLGIVDEIKAEVEKYFDDALQSLSRVQKLDENNLLYQITRSLQNRQY